MSLIEKLSSSEHVEGAGASNSSQGNRRLTRGHKITIAATVVLIVLAALIGGLVGGLVSKHKRNEVKSGCGRNSGWVFDDTNHGNITMGDRSFFVHRPANYDVNTQYPVVLSFHGYGDNDTFQELITGLSEPYIRINNLPIIAVYPNGAWGPGKLFTGGAASARAWQGAPYSPYGVDDISYTQDVVKEIRENLCVDTTRLYASGKSNGAGFTNELACTASTAGIFAAFAPISAALYPTADPSTQAGCNPGRVVPLLNFHGLADPVIPFNGQASNVAGNTTYALPNIDTWRVEWALRNGCADGSSVVTNPFPNTSMNTWTCSATNPAAVVHAYSVAGLGHSWPGIEGYDGGVTAYNATTVAIIPFFDNHTLA
ncbi:carbohydrate esterase family 1 protein [Athelia psychrophila]|uniref:feruloyl esterase n=1 Tax=Athelia psychrophila TaxID=1759441 RepID=A0A165XI71_9AGAM|nr:carbohydrate esterase family 1 protein [Fibularhizoctonia sp. CBS 109695]